MDETVAIVIPLAICVVLPVAIVWIVFYFINQRNKMQSRIVLESLKANPNIDTDKLISALQTPTRGPWEKLSRKLLRGSIFTLTGIAFIFLGAFSQEGDEGFGCWVVAGVCLAVGIGFLITYWFAYSHRNELSREWQNIESPQK